jgi:hypothetical protein
MSQLIFISFKQLNDSYIAFLPMKDALSGDNSDRKLNEAVLIYTRSIQRMKTMIQEINQCKAIHSPLPARKMWQFGDSVFKLTEKLGELCFQVDGLYEHLMRDLGLKRMWLEKVIIFRRYLPDQNVIPASLNWGRCRDSPRQAASKIINR